MAEENWFFRLSRYADAVGEAIASGRVRIEPATRRNEVLAFVRAGLDDISVSRPAARSGGWGIAVPDDPDQVVYVWWDALANYVTALGYGGDDGADLAYRQWWTGDGDRVHVIGKGITRFHAVHWLALLLSAGLPLPTAIHVHEYVSIDGAKLAKSTGTSDGTASPTALAEAHGTDAVRWWLVRDVARHGDTDFTVARLLDRFDRDLAGGVGNLQSRTLALVARHLDGHPPGRPSTAPALGGDLLAACRALPRLVDAALDRFDLRSATGAIVDVVDRANRFVEAERPWTLGADRPRLDAVLGVLVATCRAIATELRPFVPASATALLRQLDADRVSRPEPVFPRLGVPA